MQRAAECGRPCPWFCGRAQSCWEMHTILPHLGAQCCWEMHTILPQSAVVKGRGSAQCCWELHTILPQQLRPSRYSWMWPCTMPLGMHTMMQQPDVAAPAGRLGSTAQRDGIWVSPLCSHSGLAFGCPWAFWRSPEQSKHRKEQIRASSPRGKNQLGRTFR